jgi:hypothetical protein
MASIINATTSTGLVSSADNSGSLQLATNNGTTAVTIGTDQRVAFVAGTAALPAITTTGDTNTGIFFSAADTIDFAEGGTAVGQFDSSANFKFNSGYGSVETAYGCRAWVNFNGSNGSINGSGGVSSVTRNGTGDYTVSYSFTFPSNTYTLWGMGRRNSSTQRPVLLCMNNSFYENTTTGARFFTMLNDSATIEDPIQFWFGAIR